MAPRNDKPTIPTRSGRRDHLRDGASRTSPTAADEQATNVINSAVRRPMKADVTPKPPPSSTSWSGAIMNTTRKWLRRTGDGKLAPDGQGGNEEEDDEVVEEEEGEMGNQNNGVGIETEMSPGDPRSSSAQLQVSEIQLPKRQLRSRSGPVLPRQKATTKKGTAVTKIHDEVPTDELTGQDEERDGEPPQKPVSSQTRAASRNLSLRAASKSILPPKPKAKRKYQQERLEPFDIPDDDPEEGASIDARPVVKRAKIMAKTPITVQSPQRATRTKTKSHPVSSVLRSIEVIIPVKSTPKKRSRPPNVQPVAQPLPNSSVTPDGDEDSLQDEEEASSVSAGSQLGANQGNGDEEVVDDEVQEDQEDEEDQPAEDEGITRILMNPSPIKPLRRKAFPPPSRINSRVPRQIPSQILGRAPSRVTNQASSRPTSAAAANLQHIFASPSERDRRHFDDDSSEDESLVDANEASDESGNDKSDDRDVLFQMRTLRKMYKVVRQVGKTWNTEERQFVLKEPLADPTTNLCSKIFAVLKRLVLSYEEGDFELDETRIAIKEELSDLQGAIEEVIVQVLRKPERDDESQEILKDLYFCILPELVHTILLAAKAYGLSKDIEQPHLKEISKLSRFLKDLAEKTLQHSSSPRKDGTKATRSNYRFSKPTKDISPDIRALCASLEAERSHRQQDKKRKERERKKSLEAKARKEQQERDSRTKQLRAEEIARVQKKSLEEAMADPVMSKLVTAELNKALVRSGQRRSSSKSVGRRRLPSSSPPAEEDQYYDQNLPRGEGEEFEDDDPELERVTVFGQNNNRLEKGPKPWTNTERAKFFDILRNKDEPYKYQRTVKELDRDMDDVISMAKDLQAVMDHEHSKGRLGEEGDLWTWQIWNPRPESQV